MADHNRRSSSSHSEHDSVRAHRGQTARRSQSGTARRTVRGETDARSYRSTTSGRRSVFAQSGTTRSRSSQSKGARQGSSHTARRRAVDASKPRPSVRAKAAPAGAFQPHIAKGLTSAHEGQNGLSGRTIAIVAGIIILVVVVAFAMPRCSANGGGQKQDIAQQGKLASQSQEQSGQAQSNVKGATRPFEPMKGVNYPDQSSLAWRDDDFVVDPDKKTDWNYEQSDRKVVYLTIDDGPSKNTERVLDILDRYGCKATFFVTGHDPDYYPWIAEAYHRGHTIGLHTMSHAYDELYASTDAYFKDLEDVGNVVKDQIGYVPFLVRFPGGSSNMISANYCPGIMTQLTKMVPERGYQYYDWNHSVGDGSNLSTEQILDAACQDVGMNNIVLLCHDSATKDTTVEALPRIIEYFQGLGYSFEALDRSSFVSHHGAGN